MYNRHISAALCIIIADARAAVGAAVVYKYDLKAVKALRDHRLEAANEIRLDIIDRYDHRYFNKAVSHRTLPRRLSACFSARLSRSGNFLFYAAFPHRTAVNHLIARSLESAYNAQPYISL